MNRNVRIWVYLFFALGLILVMMDCAKRMKHRGAQHAPAQSQRIQP